MSTDTVKFLRFGRERGGGARRSRPPLDPRLVASYLIDICEILKRIMSPDRRLIKMFYESMNE